MNDVWQCQIYSRNRNLYIFTPHTKFIRETCFCDSPLYFRPFLRRVHITRATLLQLGDRFEVEPGEGGSRESYLAQHKVETFLIVPPKVTKIFLMITRKCKPTD